MQGESQRKRVWATALSLSLGYREIKFDAERHWTCALGSAVRSLSPAPSTGPCAPLSSLLSPPFLSPSSYFHLLYCPSVALSPCPHLPFSPSPLLPFSPSLPSPSLHISLSDPPPLFSPPPRPLFPHSLSSFASLPLISLPSLPFSFSPYPSFLLSVFPSLISPSLPSLSCPHSPPQLIHISLLSLSPCLAHARCEQGPNRPPSGRITWPV